MTEANRGFEIRDTDRMLVKELQEKGFSDGIINVLLYYVLFRSYRLRFNVVREIAAFWQTECDFTMEKAVVLARIEDYVWQEGVEKRRMRSVVLNSGNN